MALKQIEKGLLLFRSKFSFGGEELLDDQLLHFPLAGKDLFLLGPDSLATGPRIGDEIDQLAATTVDLATCFLARAAKPYQAGFDALPLLVGRSDLLS